MLRCRKCKRKVKHTTLIVIGDGTYCSRCLFRIKSTGEVERYYTSVRGRVFVSFKYIEGLEVRSIYHMKSS
ncbi:hypothetical protein [Alkaliphilus sp. B6464]|uniref:hypothetical protein n=1 Tax=Alkaliphilus sp. B6464 TaxID=2731219 RepID=UPI001BACCFAA|nr:hypothetical protein [Alkaliphilus sp. B6464]QUH20650.1 hypothetical protein HYG84_12720 [Alkaliphilus sp. B6464]